MKKNNVMRVFSLLLALTLISVCAISGTFAKYVTRASGEDTARVAKWGVLLTVEGNNFGTEYAAEDEAYLEAKGEYSVVSSNGDAVVAPGTSSKLIDAGMTASVTGTPEVAARYTIEGTVTDIVLKAGEYTDYTQLVKANDGTYGYTGKFTLDKDYAPVKWNLVISGKGQEIDLAKELYKALPTNLIAAAENYGLTKAGCSFFDAITIIQKVAGNEGYKNIVETALGNIVHNGRNFELEADKDAGTFKLSYDFDPNKEMDFTFDLSWSWAFVQENVELYDKADTFLGNWAADASLNPNNGSSININATLTATATQID